MADESQVFHRQLDICAPSKLTFPITVIGAGAIGSATVVTLAKMGCSNITVWDNDELTEHNIPNQLCLVDGVGKPKLESLQQLVKLTSVTDIKCMPYRYKNETLSSDVVISAVDSMGVRKDIWTHVKHKASVRLFLDPRMGAEVLRLYAVTPSDPFDADFYENMLYSDDEAEDLPCSARAIIYCPTIAAGLIASLVKKLAVNQPIKNREFLVDIPNISILKF